MGSPEVVLPTECKHLWVPLVKSTRFKFNLILEGITMRMGEQYDPSANMGIGNDFELDGQQWEAIRAEIREIPGVVGIGRSRLVIVHPEKSDKILSIAHNPSSFSELDRAVKVNRLMTLLFPDNFPSITNYFAFGQTKADSFAQAREPTYDYSGFEAVRIIGPEADHISGVNAHTIDCKKFKIWFPGDKRITSEFKRVVFLLDRFGLDFVRLGFDFTKGNLMLDEKGREMYVELLRGPRVGARYNHFRDKFFLILQEIEQEIAEGRMNVNIEQVRALLDDLAQ